MSITGGTYSLYCLGAKGVEAGSELVNGYEVVLRRQRRNLLSTFRVRAIETGELLDCKFHEVEETFENEVSALENIRHPNVVNLEAFVPESEEYYWHPYSLVLLEYEHYTLTDYVSYHREEKIALKDSKQIFEVHCLLPTFFSQSVVEGLQACHHTLFIHGDLRPHNIACFNVHLDKPGVWKLTGFEYSVKIGEEAVLSKDLDFAPPEHFLVNMSSVSGEEGAGTLAAHPSQDLFTLGRTLYWMRSARSLWKSPQPDETTKLQELLSEEDFSLPTSELTLTHRVSVQILAGLLKKKPEERLSLLSIRESTHYANAGTGGRSIGRLLDSLGGGSTLNSSSVNGASVTGGANMDGKKPLPAIPTIITAPSKSAIEFNPKQTFAAKSKISHPELRELWDLCGWGFDVTYGVFIEGLQFCVAQDEYAAFCLKSPIALGTIDLSRDGRYDLVELNLAFPQAGSYKLAEWIVFYHHMRTAIFVHCLGEYRKCLEQLTQMLEKPSFFNQNRAKGLWKGFGELSLILKEMITEQGERVDQAVSMVNEECYHVRKHHVWQAFQELIQLVKETTDATDHSSQIHCVKDEDHAKLDLLDSKFNDLGKRWFTWLSDTLIFATTTSNKRPCVDVYEERAQRVEDLAWEAEVQQHYIEIMLPMPITMRQICHAAVNNNPAMQVKLGTAYLKGNGIAQDLTKAVFWLRVAAKLNHVDAFLHLGNVNAAFKDYKGALKCYQRASELGSSIATASLANCYLHGFGVVKDYKRAFSLYQKYAEIDGGAASFCDLAHLYLSGLGVAKKPTTAIALYQKAAANMKYPTAYYHLGRCYLRGLGVPPDARQAVQHLRTAVELGHAAALSELGECYLYGDGVTCNQEKAVDLFTKASDRGISDALVNLAYCHGLGIGLSSSSGIGSSSKGSSSKEGLAKNVDEETSVALLFQAADEGNAVAQSILGFSHRNCLLGLAEDPPRAFHWYSLAAENDFLPAKVQLGVFYLFGYHVDVNHTLAIPLLEEGVQAGNDLALTSLAHCYRNGVGVPIDLERAISLEEESAKPGHLVFCDKSPWEYLDHVTRHAERSGCVASQLTLGQTALKEKRYERALHWFTAAAATGNQDALFSLGELYLGGIGISRDFIKAKLYFEQAGDHPKAVHHLGKLYEQEHDLVSAVENYVRAIELGSLEAKCDLGRCYMDGLGGLGPDEMKAFQLFFEAAAEGNPNSQFYLGKCYLYSIGVERDQVKAFRWFSRAAEDSHPDAMYWLARCFLDGLGTERNWLEAALWLKKAADEAHPEATEDLKRLRQEFY